MSTLQDGNPCLSGKRNDDDYFRCPDIIHADGVSETFEPGEVVFVAKGSKMTWHITKRLRKYYMTSV
jgi:hypothetical protein